jgi:hypothetical protein
MQRVTFEEVAKKKENNERSTNAIANGRIADWQYAPHCVV